MFTIVTRVTRVCLFTALYLKKSEFLRQTILNLKYYIIIQYRILLSCMRKLRMLRMAFIQINRIFSSKNNNNFESKTLYFLILKFLIG